MQKVERLSTNDKVVENLDRDCNPGWNLLSTILPGTRTCDRCPAGTSYNPIWISSGGNNPVWFFTCDAIPGYVAPTCPTLRSQTATMAYNYQENTKCVCPSGKVFRGDKGGLAMPNNFNYVDTYSCKL